MKTDTSGGSFTGGAKPGHETAKFLPKKDAPMDYGALMRMALEAREKAWAPYSNYLVGAALLGRSGKVYLGCNVENASYPAANCAERSAFFQAISLGERTFTAIAIAGGHKEAEKLSDCFPCGICRQVMREFCDPDFAVIVGSSPARWRIYTLKKLLPYSFGADALQTADKTKEDTADADV